MRKIILTSLVLLAFLAVTGLKVNTAQAYERYARVLASAMLEVVTAWDANGNIDREAIREYRANHTDGLKNVDMRGLAAEVSTFRTKYILFDVDTPDTIHVNYTSEFKLIEGIGQTTDYAILLNVSGYNGLQVGAMAAALDIVGIFELKDGDPGWQKGCSFFGGCVPGSKSVEPPI